MTLEQFQRDVVRSSFMIAQGRQWLQIPCLDSIFRMLLAQGVEIDWEVMGGSGARNKIRKRALPPGHVPVDTSGQVPAVFELWLQCALWIGRYVYDSNAGWLPSNDHLDEFTEVELGLEPWVSSVTEEELAGMKVMFGRYRDNDPHARLTADEAILRLTADEQLFLHNPVLDQIRPSLGVGRPHSPRRVGRPTRLDAPTPDSQRKREASEGLAINRCGTTVRTSGRLARRDRGYRSVVPEPADLPEADRRIQRPTSRR